MSKGAEDDHHPDHQDAVLKYNVRTGPGLRPYWFIRDQTPKDEKDRPEHYRMGRGYGPMVDVNVRLRSARPTEGEVTPSFSLDETSFKLVTERCSTSLSTADFYGPMTEENRHKYYDEMRSLLSRELGTPFVRIMSGTKRGTLLPWLRLRRWRWRWRSSILRQRCAF